MKYEKLTKMKLLNEESENYEKWQPMYNITFPNSQSYTLYVNIIQAMLRYCRSVYIAFDSNLKETMIRYDNSN